MNRKKAIVTGAGTGIGQGVAIALAKAGYDVAVHYHSSAEGAEQTVREIERCGARGYAIRADLSEKEQIDRLFSQALEQLGGLDLFVNNSGVTMKTEFPKTTQEQFDFLCGIDFKAAYFCVQAAANAMIARNTHGSIVIITSNNAFQTRPDLSLYGSMKAALVKFGRHAAAELARYQIRVNTIAPGWTATPRTCRCDMEQITAQIPLKRWAQPEEIGGIVLFYASDAATSITGNCITVDGGATLVDDELSKYGL